MQPSVDPRTTPVPSGLEIHVLEGDDAGRTFPLETWETVLGRRMTPEEKKAGWILLNDHTVSRMHAVLEWRAGPRRYRLTHMSRTNPTLVNGRLVQQAVLYPEDVVRIGDVTFEVRLRRRGEAADEARRQEQERGAIYSGFKLVVANGIDQGRQFILDRRVIHLGGPEAEKTSRGENWIVLQDPNLPREQAFLVWYEADKKYGIFHAGTSPVPTQISRVPTGNKPSPEETRNLLQLDDMVILGDTVLMVLKHELFMETARAMRAGPPIESEPLRYRPKDEPAASAQPLLPEVPAEPLQPAAPSDVAEPPAPTRGAPFHPERLKEQEDAATPAGDHSPGEKARTRARDLLTEWTEGRNMVEISAEKKRERQEESAEKGLSVRVKGAGLPQHLLGAGPVNPDRPHDATYGWFSRPDYILEVIEGPDLGKRVALMSTGMRDGRKITVGSAGKRVNDVELKDFEVSNEQAYIHYRMGQFKFVNQASGNVSINEIEVDEGQTYELKNGDEIRIGRNLLLFIDHQAMERQFQFELELIAEKGEMLQPRTFILAQDTVTIGRSKKSDVRIDDPAVSRHHCQVAFKRGGFVIEHKSDTNPTFINGVSLEKDKERMLQPGDEIQLSDQSVLVFRRKTPLQLEA